MQKYRSIFKNYLASALEYRAVWIGIIIMRIIGVGSVIVLWLSVYRDQEFVGGLSRESTIIYYILIPLIGFFTRINLADDVADHIRTGYLTTHLLKPQKVWLHYFAKTAASRVNTVLVIVPFYVVLLLGLSSLIDTSFLSLSGILATITIVFFAFIFSYLLDMTFACVAFWTTTLWWLPHVKTVTFGIFAGSSFPFEFLPESFIALFNFLPFKFLYYVPISYLTNTRSLEHLLPDILSLLIWSFGLFLFGRWLWQKGIVKYEAFGN